MEVEKKSIDRQISGMAGEFLVAGKLFKRGFQVAVTMGNAKSIDLFVFNPCTNRTFNVQVKTLRSKNCFLINKERISKDDIYVFVILNRNDQNEDFFIVRGHTILEDINHFYGSCYLKEKAMPAINYGSLREYQNNWTVFDEL